MKKLLLLLATCFTLIFTQFVSAITLTAVCTQIFVEDNDSSLLNVWLNTDKTKAFVAYAVHNNNPYLKKVYQLNCNDAKLRKENVNFTCVMPLGNSETGGLNIKFIHDTQNKMMLIFESTLLDEEGNLFSESENIGCIPSNDAKRHPLVSKRYLKGPMI